MITHGSLVLKLGNRTITTTLCRRMRLGDDGMNVDVVVTCKLCLRILKRLEDQASWDQATAIDGETVIMESQDQLKQSELVADRLHLSWREDVSQARDERDAAIRRAEEAEAKYRSNIGIQAELAAKLMLATDNDEYPLFELADVLIADRNDLRKQKLTLEQTVSTLREALSGVMEQISKGALVRETADDNAPGWGMRQIPLVMALKKADSALSHPAAEEGK